MEYRKTKKQIDKIIDISSSIYTIYNKLKELEKTNNYSEYETYINYLKIATEIEDKTYNELESFDDIDDFYKIFNYYIKDKTSNNISSISERIENHMAYIFYGDTTEEKTNDTVEGIEENSNKVIFAASTDFSYNLVNELNTEIITTTDKEYRDGLIKEKYEIIYSKKNVEYNLLTNRNGRTTEKKSLMINGQDHKLVTDTYLMYITDVINYNIMNLIIKGKNKTEIDNKISLLFLKTYLKSLTIYEQLNIYASFQKFIRDNTTYELDSNNISKIAETFMDTMNSPIKDKQKTKTNKR